MKFLQAYAPLSAPLLHAGALLAGVLVLAWGANPSAALVRDSGGVSALASISTASPTRPVYELTLAQADQMEFGAEDSVIVVALAGITSSLSASAVVEQALQSAYASRAKQGLGKQTSVLVRGPDHRLNSIVAQRLHDEGFAWVYQAGA
jgi:hypothetical protein